MDGSSCRREHGLADLAVEVLGELRGGGLQRARAALAIGVGDLIEPRILQPGERRQQHQHGRGEQRDARNTRRGDSITEASLACEKWPKIGQKPLFTSLTTSLPRLYVEIGRDRVFVGRVRQVRRSGEAGEVR